MSSWQPPPGYSFLSVTPNTPNLPDIAQNYKTLRLSALQLSPNSFSSTYTSESTRPDSAWISLLTTPGRTLFICSTTAATRHEEEFVSALTMLGPLTGPAFTLVAEAGQPPVKQDDIEQRWQLSSLYTLPSHRGKSLGRKLSQYAIAQLRAATTIPELRVRLMVAPTNTVAIKMYEAMGFEHSGKCTMEDAVKANGELESFPKAVEFEGDGEDARALRQKYHSRRGFIMQLIV